ncbi:hypothetical protein CLOP_g21255, partial [Closterium sp. NIES-67]
MRPSSNPPRSSLRAKPVVALLLLLLVLCVHHKAGLVGAETVSLHASQIAPLQALETGLNETLVYSDQTCETTSTMGDILCDAEGYVTEI